MSFNPPDFITFCKVISHYYYEEKFIALPHVAEIARYLVLLFCGKLPGGARNLMINIPPRHGKTRLMRLFFAYCYGLSPKSRFIYTSYSDDLTAEASNEIKGIIECEAYQEMFPWVKVERRGKRNTDSEWYTTENGGMKAKPSGGQITGFGAGSTEPGFYGLIGIDDPIKPLEARSSTVRNNIIKWYNGTIRNRKNSGDTPILLIMQRLHPNDLCGYLLQVERDKWFKLDIPVINSEGELLWPEKVDIDEINLLKEVDEFTYYAQYMQSPIMPGGNLFKESWWQRWGETELNQCLGLFMTADTAAKKNVNNDQSAIAVWAYCPSHILLIDLVYGRWQWPELVENAKQLRDKYKPIRSNELPLGPIFIEDRSTGTSLEQHLVSEGIEAIPWSERGKDKIFWGKQTTFSIKLSRLMIPEKAPWLEDFLKEAREFSEDDSHDHDDLINTAFIADDIWRNSGGIIGG